MGDVEIVNESLATSQIQELQQIANQVKQIADQLGQCTGKIASSWGSETADKESYLSGIQKNIDNLSKYTSAIGKMQGFISQHLEQQKAHSNRTAN